MTDAPASSESRIASSVSESLLAGHGYRESRPSKRQYRRLQSWLIVSDTCVVVAAALIATLLRFGTNEEVSTSGPFSLSYWWFGLVLAAGWILTLRVYRVNEVRILGEGPEEYRRTVRATVSFFGLFSITSLLFKIDASRGYLAIALPLGLALLLLSHRLWRAWLHGRRESGRMLAQALVIGGTRSASVIANSLQAEPRAGVRVHGVWVPDEPCAERQPLRIGESSIPVFGDELTLGEAIAASGADVAIISGTDHLGHARVKDLVWELEEHGISMLLSPNVVDVADSRIGITTVARVPFLSLDPPTYSDAAAWPKKMFDRVGAAAALVLFSPVLIITALLVAISSPGPVFYRQERVGRDGHPFQMTKFRSMRAGADADLKRLLAEQGSELGIMAKIPDDPRLTRVGRFIRRYSIDELPQLFDVLRGSMSLVGPRPQRQFEVDLYDHATHRRLRVLPGITGLWQVSGRSDMPWEDAMKLDTYYVENWSMTGDAQILWRTFRAVVRSQGAY